MFSYEELEFLTNNLKLLKYGVIVDADPSTNSYEIATADGKRLSGRTAISSLGTSSRSPSKVEMFEVGSNILFYEGVDLGFIIGTVPSVGVSDTPMPSISNSNIRSTEEEKSKPNSDGTGGIPYRGSIPPDMLQGDSLISVPEGAYQAVLRGGLFTAGGSTCQLTLDTENSLYRLFSREVEHFTDTYEFRSFNDEGETNTTICASPTFFESLGADRPGEEIGVDTSGGKENRYKIDPFDRQGKWRIQLYSGWLGDNLHLFITRRGASNRRLDKTPQDGLAEVVISHDGAVRVRSCREIISEKVSNIPVPKKIREHFHNVKGDTVQDGYHKTPHEVYDVDKDNSEGLRMRYPEYHSHLIDHEEKRHFKDHSKDWNVVSERGDKDNPSSPPPTAQDIYEGQEEAEFEETFSVIHQRSDGTVYIEDTYGTCIDTAGGNLALSSKGHIRIQAGKDILMTSGRETTIRTLEDLDVVSHNGNIRVKANDSVRVCGEGSATLESVNEQCSVVSRKGDVLLRSERKDTFIKSDIGDVNITSVNSSINLRSKNFIGIIVDEGPLKLYSSDNSELISSTSILIGVADLTPKLDMSAEIKDVGPSKTDATKSTSRVNEGSAVGFYDKSFLFLDKSSSYIRGSKKAVVDSENISLDAKRSHLKLSKAGYELSTVGSGILRREGNKVIQERDSDIRDRPEGGDVLGSSPYMSEEGDYIWTFGDNHSPLNERLELTSDVKSVDVSSKDEEFLKSRFSYKEKENRNDDYYIYEYPWQHDGGKISLYNNLIPISKKIPYGKQDIPDIGAARPIKSNQGYEEEEGIEQVAPYSKYKKFKDGTYSFENSIVEGSFEDSKEFVVIDDSKTVTGKTPGVGRINKIPDEARGSSFKGDVDYEPSEDPINDFI